MAIADGHAPISLAARWAAARVQEGGADATMLALAHCEGKSGERMLHEWANKQPWRATLPQPYAFRAPLAEAGGDEARLGILHCLLPHEVFAAISAETPAIFDELFGSIAERCHFWEEMERTANETDEPRGAEHRRWRDGRPTRHVPMGQRIPMGMHGDGGEMHGGEKITAFSWGGLCRRGSTVDTRLLFAVLKDSQAAGQQTLTRALEVFAWSFKALAAGKYPAQDEQGRSFGPSHHPERAALAGQPLALGPDGPLHGAWAELRGDWPFLRQVLELKNHFSAHQACHLCSAHALPGPMYYGCHFRADSTLQRTLVGPAPGGPRGWTPKTPSAISPLAAIPGFSIWRCMFDLMHCLELGLLQKIVPAALQGLMGYDAATAEPPLWPARSKAARCKQATAAYKRWAAKHVPSSARVKKITPRWVHGAFPDISGEHAKAAALRRMLPWVASLAEQRRGDSQAATLRATCLTELAAMDAVWAHLPRFLTRGQEAQAQKHCTQALQALAELCRLQPDGPWRLSPKAHALWHITQHSAMANPRVSHCYQDEDFIGKIKNLYTACHGATAPLRTLERYCLGTCASLQAREQLLAGERAPRAPPPKWRAPACQCSRGQSSAWPEAGPWAACSSATAGRAATERPATRVAAWPIGMKRPRVGACCASARSAAGTRWLKSGTGRLHPWTVRGPA